MDAVQFQRQLADFRGRWDSLNTQLTPILHVTASKVAQELVRLTKEVKLALRSLDFDTVTAHVDIVAQLNRFDDDLDATWQTLSSSVQPLQIRQAIGEVSSGLRSALLAHPSEEAEVLYNQGDQLVNRREYTQAIDKFTRAILIRPGEPGYWFARAFAHSNLGNHNAAGQDGEMGCKLAPHRTASWGDLATIRFQAGDMNGALEAIETALQLDNRYEFGLDLRAKLKRQIERGLHAEAAKRRTGQREAAPVICHRCHIELSGGEGFWVDLDLTQIGRIAKGHLYCSQCIENVYREAIGEIDTYADDVSPRIPRGSRSNFLGWLLAKFDRQSAPEQFAAEKTEMRQEIARQVRSEIDRLGGSKQAWLDHCHERVVWWWKHHGARYL